MKNIIIVLLLMAGMAFVSCKKFLEPKSETEYTPKSVDGLNEMLLQEAYPSYDFLLYWIFLGYLDDDITLRPWMETTTGTPGVSYYQDTPAVINAKIMYTWKKDFYELLAPSGIQMNIYGAVYDMIAGANAALDYADELKAPSKNDRLNVKAQAYTMRGFHYLHLTNIYGTPIGSHPNGLGIPLKLTSKVEAKLLTRKTVKECYDRIVLDLLAAEECYVEMGDAHQWQKNYRTSLPMTRLLLSRVYLYMGNWQEAARYAKMVMDDATFSLYDLNDYPVPSKKRPSSSDPEVPYVNFISYTSPETIWLYSNVFDGFISTLLYKDTKSKETSSPTLFNASKELTDCYSEKSVPGSDLRLDHYLVNELEDSNNEELSLKRPFGKISISTYNYGRLPYQPRGTNTASGYALRLSEAYLNYAEAMVMMVAEGESGGDVSLALSALNQLREHRIRREDYTPLKATDFPSSDDLVNFVRNERRRELCFEGHRWFDLRRWGMPELVHTWQEEKDKVETYVLPAGDSYYAIPLPPEVLERNSALDRNTWQ